MGVTPGTTVTSTGLGSSGAASGSSSKQKQRLGPGYAQYGAGPLFPPMAVQGTEAVGEDIREHDLDASLALNFGLAPAKVAKPKDGLFAQDLLLNPTRNHHDEHRSRFEWRERWLVVRDGWIFLLRDRELSPGDRSNESHSNSPLSSPLRARSRSDVCFMAPSRLYKAGPYSDDENDGRLSRAFPTPYQHPRPLYPPSKLSTMIAAAAQGDGFGANAIPRSLGPRPRLATPPKCLAFG
ncbi:hypothetical protein H1R20_g11415, partial [Candolleomyces eurysporus]